MTTKTPRSKLAAIIEHHYFIDREMYYDHCYCHCGEQFDPRRGPTEWSQHVADIIMRGHYS